MEKRGRTELSGRRNSKCDIGWSSSPMNSGHQSALCQRYPQGIIGIRDQVETLPPALGRDGQISALSNPGETPATHGVVPSVGSWQQLWLNMVRRTIFCQVSAIQNHHRPTE